MNTPLCMDWQVGGSLWGRWAGRRNEPWLSSLERSQARDRRLLCLLIGFWIVHLFDLRLTLLAYQQNILGELNPLAARVLPHGDTVVIFYKLALLTFGTGVLWWCRRHPLSEKSAWVYAAICIGLSFWWHQIYFCSEPIWTHINIAGEIPSLNSLPPPAEAITAS